MALREIERDPDRLVEEIVTLRAYARAKQIVDAAKSARDIPDTPMTDLVLRHEAELIKARMQRRRGED